MKIHGIPLSVHTRKVILAARLKDIPYDLNVVIPVIPDNPPPNWRSLSPTGLIPAIEDNGFTLADSTAIIHYLERKRPTPSLFPKDDRQFAKALFLDAWAGAALFRALVHPVFHNEVVAPKIRKVAPDTTALDHALTRSGPEAFAYLESLSPGSFLVGDTLSIADLAVVSNLITFQYLGRRIDAARYPRLAAWFKRHMDSALMQSVLAAEKPAVDQMGLDRSFIGTFA
jgi:glutathione S-transferase